LKKKHPKQYAESQTARGPAALAAQAEAAASVRPKHTTLTQAFDKGTPYDKSSKRWKEVTEAVTFYLAKDMVPLKTVENEGFKRLLKVVDPRSELPSRKYFSNTAMPRLYSECQEKIERKVQKVQFFATTSDLWSSHTSESYLSLTIHYIDDWKLCSATQQTTFFPEDQTGSS